ncbi:MAG: hypothetical protein ACXWNJ_10505 [Vulcanimicrobiaceae bacterium]
MTTTQGPVNIFISGGFELNGGTATNTSYWHILTDSSTSYLNGKVTIGSYAIVTGVVQSRGVMLATSVIVFPSKPGTSTINGTVVSATPYGCIVSTGSSQTPVAMTAATALSGAPLTVGAIVSVTGQGSASTGLLASQIQVSAAPVITVPSATTSTMGPISIFITGGFELNGGTATNPSYWHIYTNASTFISNGPIALGKYAIVTGTVPSRGNFNAGAVMQFASAPPSGTVVTGTVISATPYGFVLDTGSGQTPIAMTGATLVAGVPLTVGTIAKVTGTGSAGIGILAVQILVSAPTPPPGQPTPAPTPTPAPISMTHVLTGDYLGGAWGTTAITPAQAAPYLTWAQTRRDVASSIAAAGIKTQDYIDPNRVTSTSPLWGYALLHESDWAHTCNGGHIQTTVGSSVLTVLDPTATSTQTDFASYVSSEISRAHFDAVFEDNAGALTQYTAYSTFSPDMPCSYTDAAWIAGGGQVNQASPIPIIVNGIEAAYNGGPSQELQLLTNNSNTVGANFEHCYSDVSNPKYFSSVWILTENSELIVGNENKLFECMLRDTNSADSSLDARLYAYASFLLTYNPHNSIYWSEFGTPTGFHVLPESQLVPMDPLVATPSDVSALQIGGGNYGREYAHCYIAGAFAGPCAVVVNPDKNFGHTFPYPQYQHTLVLNGSGILDNGTIATNGPPPPVTLPPGGSAIVFP